ncbi:hypothetical protein H4Q26_001988 [Puccinia striiformis f. sp. tritici PST-130]|nr:hypothetical protein H4Q26_001988 [Puccinia striiformis f. sp. tritici PST-130]
MPIPTPQRTSPRKSSAANKTIVAPLKRFQSRETYTELRKKWGVDEDDDDDRSIEDQSELQTINHQRAPNFTEIYRRIIVLNPRTDLSFSDTNIPDLLSLQRSSAIEFVNLYFILTVMIKNLSNLYFEFHLNLLTLVNINLWFSLKSDCLQVLGFSNSRSVQESVLSKHFEDFWLELLCLSSSGLLPQRSIVHSTAFAAVINGLKVHTIRLNELFDTSIKVCFFQRFYSQEEGYKILKHVGYCMDVIEACTVSEEDALTRHHHLTHISMSALDILIGCLRSMVNMTNYNSSWSDELSSPSVIESICGLFGICREGFNNQHQRGSIATPPKKCSPKRKTEDGSMMADLGRRSAPDNRVDHVVFDLLCVCLGLLTNLLEQSGLATNILRETHTHDDDDDDGHQSINEIEIIKSFKNI